MLRVNKTLVAVLVGVGAGIASGLLGVGGGIVMVPLLVSLLGATQHRAHATSLAAIVVIGAFGALVFGLEGELEFVPAVMLTLGAIVGAPLGARLMARSSEGNLKIAFGLWMVVVGVTLVVS